MGQDYMNTLLLKLEDNVIDDILRNILNVTVGLLIRIDEYWKLELTNILPYASR